MESENVVCGFEFGDCDQADISAGGSSVYLREDVAEVFRELFCACGVDGHFFWCGGHLRLLVEEFE